MTVAASAEVDGQLPQDTKLVVAQKIFLCTSGTAPPDKEKQVRAEILDEIKEKSLAPIYQYVVQKLNIPLDQKLLNSMNENNAKEIQLLEDKIKDAQENLGETDVRDALLAKADFLADHGYRTETEAAYAEAEKQTAGVGLKLDMVFSRIRVLMLYGDWTGMKTLIGKGKILCDQGGDWERKNRLKVYEATLLLATRDLKKAADLFLDSIATFTCSELFDYSRCVLYGVVTGMMCLDRNAVKSRILDSPEVLQVIDSIPNLQKYLHSLYYCQYNQFFKSFVAIAKDLSFDMYLAPHMRYYVREMRLVAYTQYLDAYKSVKLSVMANTFGVSEQFVDRELSNFVVLGRLSAKVDKVAGVVETNRPDSKNFLYQQVMKQGDALLNRLQKLSKVIDIE